MRKKWIAAYTSCHSSMSSWFLSNDVNAVSKTAASISAFEMKPSLL